MQLENVIYEPGHRSFPDTKPVRPFSLKHPSFQNCGKLISAAYSSLCMSVCVFICISVFVSVHVYTHVYACCISQKRVSELLELEL